MDDTRTLAQQVRRLVRDRRIDPRTDTEAVRRVAVDVVAQHEARSLTGAVPSLDDAEVVVGQLVADIAGLGPSQPFLEDPGVEGIWINEPGLVR